MYIGGLMGCKGDAYKATDILTMEEARAFHSWSVQLYENAGVDFLFAGIMPALSEAVGMAQAMEETKIPYIISFMMLSNILINIQLLIHFVILQIVFIQLFYIMH